MAELRETSDPWATTAGNSHTSFTSLPDEVIKEVFQFGVSDEAWVYWEWDKDSDTQTLRTYDIENPPPDPRNFAGAVSQVNTRIRNIALATPSLWVYISSRLLGLDGLRALLARSRLLGLVIFLSTFREGVDIGEFIALLREHATRFRQLYVGDQDDIGEQVYPALREINDVDFPLLWTLEWTEGDDQYDPDRRGCPDAWKMPALSSIAGDVLLSEDFIVPTKITSWDACFPPSNIYARTFEEPALMVTFHSRLASYTHLRILMLTFHDGGHMDLHPNSLPTVDLPNLTILYCEDISGFSDIWDYVYKIRAPILEKLTLSPRPRTNSLHPDVAQRCLRRFPSIRELCVASDPRYLFGLRSFVNDLPNLRSLSLERLGLAVTEYTASEQMLSPLAALHEIRLKSCVGLTPSYVEALVNALGSTAHCTHLEIRQCNEIWNIYRPVRNQGIDSAFLERLNDIHPERVQIFHD